jgi:DNA-binding response OmpR family regulator
MNLVVALKDYTDLDRVVRPLVAAGHQVTPVTKYASLKRTLDAVTPDLVLADWGFGPAGDQMLVAELRGAEPDGPRVLMLLPERWPVEAAHLFDWGAHDFVRRPLSGPELVIRVDRLTGVVKRSAAELPRGAPASWRHFAFWRDLEATVTAELAATIAVPLTATPSEPTALLSMAGISRMLLPADEIELIVGVGLEPGTDGPLAAALLGGPALPEVMGDALSELTNVAAGAIKRSALAVGKVFALGLPRLHHDGARSFPLERQWRAVGPRGLTVHCMAGARSTRPEILACSHLREGMVVTNNVLGPTGTLIAAQGTCLTERSVERLRAMLGDRFAVEITQAGFAL